MGIFDAVLGKKDTGGGLFSKKSAFVEKKRNGKLDWLGLQRLKENGKRRRVPSRERGL